MNVPKDEPMNNLAGTDDDFDALLDASSLGAPHVVAVTGDIPDAARRRMALAARRQQRTLDDTASREEPPQHDQADHVIEAGFDPRTTAQDTATDHHPASPALARRGFLVGGVGAGKSSFLAALAMLLRPFPARHHPTASPQLSDRRIRDLRHQMWTTRESLEAHGGSQSPFTADGGFSIWVAHPCRLAKNEPQQGVASAADPRQLSTLLALTGMNEVHGFLPSAHIAPGPDTGCLPDLREFVRPAAEPVPSLALTAEPMSLVLCTAKPAQLQVARFADSAYKRARSGLMLPEIKRTASQHQQLTPLQRSERTSPSSTQPARQPAAQARLWTTTPEGARVQHADMPMLIHHEEHEALTQTLRTRFTYRASDPYAVEARFRAEESDETVWTFARELLVDGLERSAGRGDVTLWPEKTASGQRRLFIRLTSPEGTALLSAAAVDVRLFVEAAGSLVEYGSEHTHLAPALNALETAIRELTRPGTRE
ncbi:SsgA family sporulation/cell division regulator [Streptomyces coeruleorubidus]|uniref:SsgA family sporulation/cell division regulator n=1 Tax=Streptomyces coeruleorubidus TaxID=116188 RepID=UPI0038127F0A